MPSKKRTLETGGEVHGDRGKKDLRRTQNLGAPAEAIGSPYETPAPKHKSRPKIGNVLPKYLYREVARVHRLAREAGLFLEDRDFLHCAHCGLLEDVGCCGLLMTYPTGKPPVDSGLRFKKDKRGLYVCPACGAVARMEKGGGVQA
jgi:primosomal protein N'